MTTELEAAVGATNTLAETLVERSKADYSSLKDQIAEAQANIEHNANVILSARETIRLAQEGNRRNQAFIREARRKMRKVAKFRFDMEQIEEGN